MGRPPIGKHAMSGSERQRRYLARLLGEAGRDTKPSTDGKEQAQDRAEIATVRGYVEALGGEVEIVAKFGDERITVG